MTTTLFAAFWNPFAELQETLDSSRIIFQSGLVTGIVGTIVVLLVLRFFLHICRFFVRHWKVTLVLFVVLTVWVSLAGAAQVRSDQTELRVTIDPDMTEDQLKQLRFLHQDQIEGILQSQALAQQDRARAVLLEQRKQYQNTTVSLASYIFWFAVITMLTAPFWSRPLFKYAILKHKQERELLQVSTQTISASDSLRLQQLQPEQQPQPPVHVHFHASGALPDHQPGLVRQRRDDV